PGTSPALNVPLLSNLKALALVSVVMPPAPAIRFAFHVPLLITFELIVSVVLVGATAVGLTWLNVAPLVMVPKMAPSALAGALLFSPPFVASSVPVVVSVPPTSLRNPVAAVVQVPALVTMAVFLASPFHFAPALLLTVAPAVFDSRLPFQVPPL